jgi:hypothetical protein
MWAQIVGKIRNTQTPLINHWWNVTLERTARWMARSLGWTLTAPTLNASAQSIKVKGKVKGPL